MVEAVNVQIGGSRLSARMRKIAGERARLQEQLEAAEVDLSTGREVLTELCELLANPRELYQQASRRARRSHNKAIFSRLYLDGDYLSRVVVSGDELNDGVAPIVRSGKVRCWWEPGGRAAPCSGRHTKPAA